MTKNKKAKQLIAGETTLKRHGREHYVKMSRKGVLARKKIWELGKKSLEEKKGGKN